MKEKIPVGKKLIASAVVIALLIAGLCVTTFALVWSIITIDDNIFGTNAGVGIVLLDPSGENITTAENKSGKPIITGNEGLFEPGKTLVKEFMVENVGACDVWYRVSFANISGELADILTAEIREKESGRVLCSGKVSQLTSDKVGSGELAMNERVPIEIVIRYSGDSDNSGMNKTLLFDISVDATQKKNNPYMNYGN